MATFDMVLSNFAIDSIGYFRIVRGACQYKLYLTWSNNEFRPVSQTTIQKPIRSVANFDKTLSNVAIFVEK